MGVPGSIGHDLGVIVLDQPVDLPACGSLPAQGSLDGATGTALTLVGYGAQGWVPRPGGRISTFSFVRMQAQSTLINDTNATGGEFVLISTNPGRHRPG